MESGWPIICINNDGLFRSPPLLANKVGLKISNQLIRARFKSKHSGQTGRAYANPDEDCQQANCRYCSKMNKSKCFKSTYTGYTYTTKLRGHCTTHNLVYLITCTKCVRQYVGETKREFRYRMTEHIRDTQLNRDTPVANHYNQTSHSTENMLFQIIHILPTDAEDDRSMPRRRECEKYWIYQLHSLKPLGLNVFG